MFAFSTCWNSHRHLDGRKMLQEIRDLGFEFAELSHGTRISLMPGILDAVDSNLIRISSLHNFCPLPMGVNHAAPNIHQFSDDRSQERELAWKHTIKTLDFAVRVKAPIVVLHSGSVDMRNYTDKLLDMLAAGQAGSAQFQKLAAEAEKSRQSKKGKYFKRTIEFLKRLAPEAETRGVLLGIENRQSLEELPFDSDFEILFREIQSPNLVYWHDTGHARIKENLGFIAHTAHLESMRAKLAGFHIHDVQYPGRDHCAPGTGTIDFAALKPFVKPEHIKVLEFSPSMSPDNARAGADFVRRTWGP